MTVKIDGTNTEANPAFTGADTDTGLQCGTDELKLVTGGTARATVDSSGRLLVGTASSIGSDTYAKLNIIDPVGAEIRIGRDDSSVTDGNGLGAIRFYGNDGGSYQECARIATRADGTHANNDKPSRLEFYTTASSASSPTERMRIDSIGMVNVKSGDLRVTGGEGISAHLYLVADEGDDNGDSWRLVSNQDENDFAISNNSSGSFTERFRIGSDGAILFENSAYAYFVSTSSSQTSLTLKKGNSGADGTDFLQCRTNNNTEKFTIKGTGNAENANGSYGSISDVKLKENIVDASSQWDDIKAVQIRNYNFKEETGLNTHTQIGVIAQELETVSPGLVSESTDRDEEGNDLGTVTKSVKQSILYMKAVKALQEAQTRIETLETQYTNLLARVTALEAAE